MFLLIPDCLFTNSILFTPQTTVLLYYFKGKVKPDGECWLLRGLNNITGSDL